ncbi:MAG TPA: hypothetical protein VNF68_02895 [Candidatus Baltobacteraceae bacterium]|nr:hypothetical protein [Candidatus Baltobacteraceae bacterium]
MKRNDPRLPGLAGDAHAEKVVDLEAHVPDNTKRAYATADIAFEEFCEHHGYRVFPAAPSACIEFMKAQRKAGADLPRLKQLRAAIRRKHRKHDQADPCKSGAFLEAWKGILADPELHAQTPTLAVLYDGIEAVVAAMAAEERELRGPNASPARRLALARDRALILTLFFGALWRSELIGVSIQDVKFFTDEICARVQASKWREPREVVLRARRDALCPVAAIGTWMREGELGNEGPLFRGIDQYGHIGGRLDAKSVYSIWARRAGLAGLSVNLFPLRALREGAIIEASLQGATTKEIVKALGLSRMAVPLLEARITRAKQEIKRRGRGLFV